MIVDNNQINNFRILCLKSGLRMETVGLQVARGSRPTCYSTVKKEFGFKGNKINVLKQLEIWIEENIF
jgi:hypothetical protein